MGDSPPQGRDRTPWLVVKGNAIVAGRRTAPGPREEGARPMILRGLNLSGLQYSEFQWSDTLRWRDAAGLTSTVVRSLSSEWNLNIVRLPVNSDWYLHGLPRAGRSGADSARMYREDIGEIVDELASAGVYTLLNPHSRCWSPADARTYTPPMPDQKLLEFWKTAASDFRNDPAVLFDLFNEPHPPLPPPAEPPFEGPVPAAPAGWVAAWHEWARTIGSAVHLLHPDALLFVSGIGGPCWSASLRSMPVPDLQNAVYAAHVYRAPPPGFGDPLSAGLRPPGTLGKHGFDHWFGFARLRRRYPVFVSEWGCCLDRQCAHEGCPAGRQKKWPEQGRKWLEKLEKYMRALHTFDSRGRWQGLAGWTAWSWGDHPHLVRKDTQGVYSLSTFGTVVKEALNRPPAD